MRYCWGTGSNFGDEAVECGEWRVEGEEKSEERRGRSKGKRVWFTVPTNDHKTGDHKRCPYDGKDCFSGCGKEA